MKTCCALAILLFLSFSSVGQTKSGLVLATPFKGANTVLVQTPDSAATALHKLGQVLAQEGYTVEKLDREVLTLVCSPKTLVSLGHPVLVIKATAVAGANSQLALTGDYTITAGKTVFDLHAQYNGTTTPDKKTSFGELDSIANAYPNGQVAYTKR
ncbi:hypothetical protein [Hymenobacter sp. BT730]|uniref:hypothetical protein n=1 Tax=Hymenobacter sp. BT730 TaxID=3063332 RepID=UPI0026E0F91C|nr:hypothetical protein [Hymenobacter sp. BT730]